MGKNTLYRTIPDQFTTEKIDTVIEREDGAIFFDSTLKRPFIWANGQKLSMTGSIPPEIKFINSLSELPAPIGGKIQLLSDCIYQPLFTTPQSMSDTIVFGDNTTWYTPNSNLGVWTYTGTGNAIEATGGNSIFIFGMQVFLAETTANCFGFDGGSSTGNMVLERFTGVGGNIGFSNDSLFTFVNQCNFVNFTDGLLSQGSNSDISYQTTRFDTYVNNAIDLGTATTIDFLMTGVRFVGGAVGSFCLSGLVDSGNITGRATISNSIWNGAGGTLENLFHCDLQYKYSGNVGNPGIEDSHANASIYIAAGDEAVTAISAGVGDSGNPIGVAGAWTAVDMCRFTVDLATGTLTYIGLEEVNLAATSKLLGDPVSGSNIEYWVHFRKVEFIGTVTVLDLLSRDIINSDANNPDKAVVISNITLNTGDTVQVVIENRTGTTNITASGMNIVIGI